MRKLLFLLLCTPAFAQNQVQVTCIAPTVVPSNVAILGYQFFRQASGSSTWTALNTVQAPAKTCSYLDNVPNGTYLYEVETVANVANNGVTAVQNSAPDVTPNPLTVPTSVTTVPSPSGVTATPVASTGLTVNFSSIPAGSAPTVSTLTASTSGTLPFTWTGPSLTTCPITGTGSGLQYATGTGGCYYTLMTTPVTDLWASYTLSFSLPLASGWYDEPALQATNLDTLTPNLQTSSTGATIQAECSGPMTTNYSAATIAVQSGYRLILHKATNGTPSTIRVLNASGVSQGTLSCNSDSGTNLANKVLVGIPGSEAEQTGTITWSNLLVSTTQLTQ